MLFTLFMPPYQFKRKSKARDIGKKAIFECISWAKNDVKTYHTMSNCPSCHWYCILQKIDQNLPKIDQILKKNHSDSAFCTCLHDHDCAPSATRTFTEWCYNAVATDPTKSIFQKQIYNWYIINMLLPFGIGWLL